ncbi:unnamed protein product [Brassica oleracea var. botrytis]
MKKMIDERDDAVDKKVEETKEEDPVVITAAPTPVEEAVVAPAVVAPVIAPVVAPVPVLALFAVVPADVSARIATDPSRRYAAVEVDPMILEAAREDPMALDLLEEVIQMAIDQATESANRGGGGGK